MLLLPENLEKEIRDHGAKDYPHECCGAMLGTDGDSGREVRSLFPLINGGTIRRATVFRLLRKIFARLNVPQPSVDLTCWDGIILIRIIRRGPANLTASMPGRGTAM